MDLYREDIMDHYENPRNQGEMSGDDVLSGRDSNASCGDMVQFFIRIGNNQDPKSNKQTIEEVRWKGIGCAITTAAASKLSEFLPGQTLQDIRKLSEEELLQKGIGFEVNPGRMKCLMLPVKVVKKIFQN